MFWPFSDYNVLFLCDTFGADRNGTYYKGENMDFFVERAMENIIDRVQKAHNLPNAQTVTAGSSMGATAALRFALRQGYAGAIAVCPHIDLDLCAQFQGRQRHVATVLGNEDVSSPDSYPVTREIRSLVQTADNQKTRIIIQSMKDDFGVHAEQVLPFMQLREQAGGIVYLDERDHGGHTSDYATSQWFKEQLLFCLAQA